MEDVLDFIGIIIVVYIDREKRRMILGEWGRQMEDVLDFIGIIIIVGHRYF